MRNVVKRIVIFFDSSAKRIAFAHFALVCLLHFDNVYGVLNEKVI